MVALSDSTLQTLKEAVRSCDEARFSVEEVLDEVANQGTNDQLLHRLGDALADWRDGQRRFVSAVAKADVADVSTAALLLKTNQGIDASNARRGVPGLPVEGADQPFDVDTTGRRGSAVLTAATSYVDD